MSVVMNGLRNHAVNTSLAPCRTLVARIMVLLCLALLLPQLVSAADRPFARRYVINTEGDMVLVGNTLTSCPTGAANCATARAGGAYNNNSFNPMAYVDVDSDSSTFNSSEADLNMLAGSTVRFAGLYWSGQSTSAARNQVLFKTPTSFGYNLVTATTLDDSGSGSLFQGFRDVTALVAAGGSGTYRVANVQSGTATNQQAGWTLVVVYSNNALPLRNFAVYDGLVYASNTTITIPVSGFLTPLSGPIATRLGSVVYDGDYGSTGDTISLNGVTLSDAVHPSNNAYNSVISDLGVNVTAKNPDYVNQLGFDLARWNVPSGIVANGATDATIRVTSPGTGEVMWVGVLTFATDIYVPIITPNVVKTAEDVNGGFLLAGDTLRWKVVMSNTGQDSGTTLVATDNIPAGLTYLPGSLKILTGANTGTKTDASADDQAEYIASGTPRVVFRLGTGANASTGGTLPYLASTSFQFDTVVNSGLPAGTPLSNAINLSYSGQTIGDVFTATSAAATAVLLAPPTIAKSFVPNVIDVGAASVLTITVGNPAGNPGTLNGVSFTDTYPSGLVNAATPNAQIACTPGSTPGTITGGVAGGNTIGLSPGATIAVNGSCTITVNVTSNAIGNYANVTSAVSSTNGGTSPGAASAILSVGRPSISKVFSPTTILSGGISTITFTLTNIASTPLTNVAFSDALTNMVVASPNGLGGTCTGTRTATAGSSSISLAGGTLAANGSCTMIVNVTSSTSGVHPNTASGVSSTQSGAAGNPSNTAELTVIAPPVLSKSFLPVSVGINVPSTMTLTVSNPNTTTTITGVAFTDTYPSDLVNDNPTSLTLNCTPGSTGASTGGANGGTTIGFTGGTLAPGGSCTITINVEAPTSGDKTNTTSTVTTTNAGTGAAASATLNVTGLIAPTVTKAFGAATIPTGGTTTMTISFSNSNTANPGGIVTGLAFTDIFPPGIQVAATPALGNTCGGTVMGASPGSTQLSLSGGTIPRKSGGTNGACAVTVTVTSSETAKYTNSTGTILSSNAGTFGPATATIDVLAPPVIDKSFSPAVIGVAPSFSTLTLTITNPTTSTVSLTGVEFSDTFPANLVVAATPTATNGCGGGTGGAANSLQGRTGAGAWGVVTAGNTGIRLQGRTIAPNTTCTVTVRVSSATAGNYINTTAAILSTNGGTGNTASATLTVAQPGITKSYATNPIAAGAGTLMTLTLSNPTATAMTATAFSDTYPAGMTNTATPAGATSCGGSVTAAANGGSVALSGGTIPANGSCTVTVNVTATQTVTNTIAAGDITAMSGATAVSNGVPATAVLNVYVPPVVTKTFSAPTIVPGGAVTLGIAVANNNAVSGTSLGFTDTFPTGMAVAATPGLSSTCGTVQGRTGAGAWGAVVAGNTAIRINNDGTVAANSSCLVSVDVTSSAVGSHVNSSGTLTTANIGSGSASSATLVVMGPPVVGKAFVPASVLVNISSTLTITLTNPDGVAITGVAFTDSYPAGLVNAPVPNAVTSCAGATLTAVAGGNSLAFSGGTIAANGSCSVTISVRSSAGGTYNNSTGVVTTTNAGNGAAATATLVVTSPMPAIGILKLAGVISDPVNGGSFAKSLPGAIVAYTIRVTNTGPGTVDNNTMEVTDPLPPEVELYVGDLGGPGGGGPVFFINGSPDSGLSWTFTSLASATDHLDFSNNNGATWTYVPVPDANGFDANVNRIRLKPSGAMKAAGGGNPYVDFIFRVRVK